MHSLVIATKNKGKFLEFKKMLGQIDINIISLLSFPQIEIEETGLSFDENALIKANAVVRETGLAAMADDSGLEVMALNGRPGIYTARYAGDNATDNDNIEKLLKEMENIPLEKRKARFVCSLALVLPDGRKFIENGFLEGYIAFEPRGTKGFGYDPVFFVPHLGKTLAEISDEEKNRISHRAKALKKLRKHILANIGG